MSDSEPALTLVIADDHAMVRKGLRAFLERASDLRVLAEAADGNEAVRMARHHRPSVLVLDLQMPGKTGIEVARILRAEQLAISVLILTAYSDEAFVSSALKAGVNGYLLKLAEPAELIRAVRDVHAGHIVLDPRLPNREAYLAQSLTRTAASPADPLSARELRVLQLVAQGHTNKAIGLQLGISDRTVQAHIATIFDKLGAHSRTEAVMIGLRSGFVGTAAD